MYVNPLSKLNGNDWYPQVIKKYGNGWIPIRKEILSRDDNCCVYCGAKNQLVIHHKIPFEIVKEHKEDNLVTLCKKDHWRVHFKDDWN